MDIGNNQNSPLSEYAQRLRESTEAICRFSSGEPSFEEGRRVFTDFCDQAGFWIDLLPCCHGQPDAYGDEHEVWLDGDHVVKLTYSDFYGKRVIYRTDGDSSCLPYEYFERWMLHNQLFGDDVEIIGAVKTGNGVRLAMRQRIIEGVTASLSQIEEFFEGNGWKRFEVQGEIAWFDQSQSLVVSDTHQGNLILTPDQVLAPIDLRIQSLTGALLDAVINLCSRT